MARLPAFGGRAIRAAGWPVWLIGRNKDEILVLVQFGGRAMRKMVLLIAGVALAGVLAAPRVSLGWTSVGLGIGYAGPYAYPWPYAPPYPVPVYYPLPYVPPVYYPPAYYGPGVFWPGYGPEIAVRWNRYFTPPPPRIQGYTLPR